LVVGLGCISAATLGAGLSIGEINTNGLSTPSAIVVGVLGAVLVVASLFVGVQMPEEPSSENAPQPPDRTVQPDDRITVALAQLAHAAASLASALRAPDAMKYNVKLAQQRVDKAYGPAMGVNTLKPLADTLLQASQSEDLAAVNSVIQRLADS